MTCSTNGAEGTAGTAGTAGGQPLAAYDPGLFLDWLIRQLYLANDAQLARTLKIDRKLLARIRDRREPISGSMLMGMQEATGIPVERLRTMLNDRRRTCRMAGRSNRGV